MKTKIIIVAIFAALILAGILLIYQSGIFSKEKKGIFNYSQTLGNQEADFAKLREFCQKKYDELLASDKYTANNFGECEITEMNIGYGKKECPEGFSANGCYACSIHCEKKPRVRR